MENENSRMWAGNHSSGKKKKKSCFNPDKNFISKAIEDFKNKGGQIEKLELAYCYTKYDEHFNGFS